MFCWNFAIIGLKRYYFLQDWKKAKKCPNGQILLFLENYFKKVQIRLIWSSKGQMATLNMICLCSYRMFVAALCIILTMTIQEFNIIWSYAPSTKLKLNNYFLRQNLFIGLQKNILNSATNFIKKYHARKYIENLLDHYISFDQQSQKP